LGVDERLRRVRYASGKGRIMVFLGPSRKADSLATAGMGAGSDAVSPTRSGRRPASERVPNLTSQCPTALSHPPGLLRSSQAEPLVEVPTPDAACAREEASPLIAGGLGRQPLLSRPGCPLL